MSIDIDIESIREWEEENEIALVYDFAHKEWELFLGWLESLTHRDFEAYCAYGVSGLYRAFSDAYDKVYNKWAEERYLESLPDAPIDKETTC